MKRTITLLLALLLAFAALTGCAKQETAPDAPDAAQENGTAEEAGLFITLNGQKVAIGAAYADIRDGLGTEIKPSEEILPCGDESSDWKRILHFYPGTVITEDQNGIICEVSMSSYNEGECTALAMGKVALGGSVAEVKKLVNASVVSEDEYGTTYQSGDTVMQVMGAEEGSDELGNVSLMRGSDFGF